MYRRRTLNREQLREYLACAREMQAEGDVLDIPAEWMESCPLTVTHDGAVGGIFDMNGITTYVIPVCIVARGRVLICGYDVYSEWDDGIELAYLQQRKGRYQFGTLDYPVSEVLNDRFESGFRLNFSGDMLRGFIIGHGGPTPKSYQTARSIAVNITLRDSLARWSTAARIHLPVNHVPNRGRSRQQTKENDIAPSHLLDAGSTAMATLPEQLHAVGE